MGLLLVLALLGGAFAVLNWLLLPRLERSWVTASTHAKYSKAGTIAAFKTLRTFLQIAIATALFTLIAATAIWLGGQIGWDMSLTVLHEFTGWVLGWLESLGKSLGLALTWLAVAGLGWMAYRVARKGLRGDLDHEFAAQKQELAKQWSKDQLPVLPPSAEMDACAEQLARAQALRDSLAQDPAGNAAALQALDDTIAKLVSFFVNSDLDRRIDLTTVPLPIDQGPGWWPQIRVLLFSKGTLRLSERTKTYVTRLATAAACFAVVGVSAPALANGAIAPLFASLTDLRVFASADRAARTLSSFAQAPVRPPMPPMPPGAADDAADDDIYVRTATHFVRALARPQVWASGVEQSVPGTRVLAATSQQQRRDLGGTMIREALLREYSAGRPGAGLASEGLAGLADEGVQTRYNRMVDGLEPDPARRFSGLVGRVEGYLRAEGARRPGFEAQLRAGLAQFRQPVQAWDYASAALGDVVGEALKEALPEVGTPRPPIERTAIKKGVERLVEIKLAGFLENVRAGKPVAQSLGEVARPESMPTLRMAEARSMASRFEGLELDAKSLGAHRATQAPSLRMEVGDIERARAERFAALVEHGLPRRAVEGMIGSYDSRFAANSSSFAQTTIAELASPSGNPAIEPEREIALFEQSRDSSQMRRSVRVGGVVIGALPRATSTMPKSTRLSWKQVGGDFLLWVTSPGEEKVLLGTFSAPMIQQALAYAADGRTVAVTILNSGIYGSKLQQVYLHPALVGTSLGEDFIALDRFVFDAIGACDKSSPQSASCEFDRVRFQLAAYEFAASNSDEPRALESPDALKLAKAAATAFAAYPSGDSARNSIFAYHSSYFQESLVQVLRSCARSGGKGYWDCVYGHPRENLSSRAPESAFVSGVGEVPYDSLSYWNRKKSLEYLAQVVFHHPDLIDRPELEGRSLSVDDGKAPWSFPSIAPLIAAQTERYAASSPERRRIAEQAESFTLLQRIFRLVLDGRLGGRADQAALVTLMRQAKKVGPLRESATPQWFGSRSQAFADAAKQEEKLREFSGNDIDNITVESLDRTLNSDRCLIDDSCRELTLMVRSWEFLRMLLDDPKARFSDS